MHGLPSLTLLRVLELVMKVILLFAVALVLCGVVSANIDLGLGVAPLLSSHQHARAAVGTCKLSVCVKQGQNCVSNTTSISCAENYNYCNRTTQVCTKRSVTPIGSACTSGDLCQDGDCVNGVCNQLKRVGASCKHDYECFNNLGGTNYVTSCVNSKCYGVPEGQSCTDSGIQQCELQLACLNLTCVKPGGLGSYCSSDMNCIQSLYCRQKSCTAYLSLGDSCDLTLTNNSCPLGTACQPLDATRQAGQCKTIFSGTVGTSCISLNDCEGGLYCNQTCSKLTATSSNTPCDSSSTCGKYEVCVCNGNTGESKCMVSRAYSGYPTGYTKGLVDYYNCAAKCLRTDAVCIANNCKNFLCSFYNAYINYQVASYSDADLATCALERSFESYQKSLITVPGYLTCDLKYDSGSSSSSSSGATQLGSSTIFGVIMSTFVLLFLMYC